MAGVNYDQAVKDYSTREGVTTLAPQVYALDADGNVFLEDGSFDPSTFTSSAHTYGFKVIPLVMAGSGLCSGSVWCNDDDILAIINNSTQLGSFQQQLTALCKSYGFDGIQLDWETTLSPSSQPAMTAALAKVADALHGMSPPRTLSLTTYYWDFHAGPYNISALAKGPIDALNLQDYTSSFSTFESNMNSMILGMGSSAKLQVGLGDYTGVNPPIAGECVQYLIQKGINTVAVWPNWGSELSFGSYGYSDTVYKTSSYYQLFGILLSS